MNKRILLVSFIIAAALGISLFAWHARGRTTSEPTPTVTPKATAQVTPPAPSAAAVISELAGSATVTRGGSSSTATIGMELKEGDEVRVDATGTLAVTFPTYGRMLVASSTNVIIRRLASDDEHTSLAVNLKLVAGRVWTRLERLLGPTDEFDIRASNVVATVRGTSYGVLLDGPHVNVEVAERQVKIREVRDREPSEDERLSGISGLALEEFTGLESDVHEGQGVNINLVAGASMESMFQPRPLDPEALNDPFVQRGNTQMTPVELRGASSVSPMTGMFDMDQYMRWVAGLLQQYPDGNIPPEAITAYFLEHGIPMDERFMGRSSDPQALRDYLQSIGVNAQSSTP